MGLFFMGQFMRHEQLFINEHNQVSQVDPVMILPNPSSPRGNQAINILKSPLKGDLGRSQ